MPTLQKNNLSFKILSLKTEDRFSTLTTRLRSSNFRLFLNISINHQIIKMFYYFRF